MRFCRLSVIVAASLGLRVAAGVTISEINYHPPLGSENLEFVEIMNDLGTPEDISGWAFVNGISYQIPPATILGPRGFLVICRDPDAVKARYGITNAVGPYSGRLSVSGERLTLVNHGRAEIVSIQYEDDGKWPVAPDGTGHTLALRHSHMDPGEPESWIQSAELGGTPGRSNFGTDGPQIVDHVIIDKNVVWSYQKGTQPFSAPPEAWREPDFDDASWPTGPSGFGYEDNDDNTVLSDMINTYTSVAVRKRFVLTAQDLSAPGELHIAVDYDDGFIAYLNGKEIGRSNAGDPAEERAHSDTATGSHERGSEEVIKIPTAFIEEGENVLAVVGFNFSIGSSDFSLVPRLIRRETITSEGGTLSPVLLNELFRGPAAGTGWVELYNPANFNSDISGFALNDNPDRAAPYHFPAGTIIGPGKFFRVTEAESGLVMTAPQVQLFLVDTAGLAAAASTFDRSAPAAWIAAGYSECRFPDGGPLAWVTRTPTPLAANTIETVKDIIINEIFYHPPEERTGEFIEIYNRGTTAVSLTGFRFDKGIEYLITAGTELAPGGYLVVSEDPALITQRYGLANVQGPWTGQLADRGEKVRLVDAAGNLVDEVRYYEGGSWSRWADGGGASLELVDARQDNSVGSAWDASDETEKTEWEEVSFNIPRLTAPGESELWFYLQERGIFHLDDVSVVPIGKTNILTNPGFETNTAPWALLGTHLHSKRITTDAHSGSACLEVVATSKGDTLANRVEVDTSPRFATGEYDVSFWVRWQRGGSLLVVQTPYTAGTYFSHPSPASNLSGNALSSGVRLSVPLNIGTPGAENSVTKNLREAEGSPNLGPVLSNIRQDPVSPAASQSATVTVRASDSDGIASLTLHHRLNNAAGAFTSVPFADDGRSGDGEAGDGIYGATIPGLGSGSRVVFYIEATDSQDATTRYPLDAPEHTCLYQVSGPSAPGLETGRLILDTQRTAELNGRPLHSNDPVDGTFVLDDEEIYYNIGTRYRGSPWGRPGRQNYRVRFQEDRTFLRGRKAISLDNSGPSPNEGAAYFLGSRVGTPDSPAPASEYYWIRAWYNGQSLGLRGLLQRVDRDLVNMWYGTTEGAQLWKVEGRRVLDDAGGLVGWEGMTFVHKGENPENYRGYLIPSMRRSVDDWSSVAELTRIMDQKVTPAAAFDDQIDSIMDVEEFLRCLAVRILYSDWDAFCIGNGHNGYMVLDPNDQRWELLPFDADNSFGNANPALFPTFDPNIARLMSRPGPKRIYYRILSDYVKGYWSAAGCGPYFDAVQAATGVGMSSIKSFVMTSGNAVKSQLNSVSNTPFRITTNGGSNILTANARIDLEGDAPVQVAQILFSINDGEQITLEPTWTTPTHWKAGFDIAEGDNAFLFLGFDSTGDDVGMVGITVTRGNASDLPTITDWSPRTGSSTGGTEVTFTGTKFAAGMQVLFGNAAATAITVDSETSARATTPVAPTPFPTGGVVDIQAVFSASSRLTLPRAYTYVKQTGFVRGDSNGDRAVDLADAIRTLFHLFGGQPLTCLDAADFNDSGSVGVTDVIATLDFLFREGTAPKAPYPAAGTDPTADSLACS